MSAHTHSYRVPGLTVNLNQLGLKPPRPNGCWATVYTMMVSWKHQQSFDIGEALDRVDPYYRTLFEMNKGLAQHESIAFLNAAGMKHEPMANYDIKGWLHLLKRHGLLWVSGRFSDTSGTHARIVEGIRIDDLPHGHLVSMMVLDPWGGRRYLELFTTFERKYEGAFRDHKGVYYQVRYF